MVWAFSGGGAPRTEPVASRHCLGGGTLLRASEAVHQPLLPSVALCLWNVDKTIISLAICRLFQPRQLIGPTWSLLFPPPLLCTRVRWFGPSEQKTHKIKTGHSYSYVKLNFRVGLFSCIFLFEAIFSCFFWHFKLTLFYMGKTAKISPKIDKIEIWPKSRPKVINSWNKSNRGHILGMFEL